MPRVLNACEELAFMIGEHIQRDVECLEVLPDDGQDDAVMKLTRNGTDYLVLIRKDSDE